METKQTMTIKPGKDNDPSIEIGSGAAPVVSQEFVNVMKTLGFTEAEGSFVYNSGGRAIWVNPQSEAPDENITKQIIAAAEAIGSRTKINEIRQALDLPFEVVATISAKEA
jgi:hypothetical protein